jgi:septal ring factor EnvC (AmiA/AmiB activator)
MNDQTPISKNIVTDKLKTANLNDGNMYDKVRKGWLHKLEGYKLGVLWFSITVLGALLIHFSSGQTFRLLSPIILLLIYLFYGYKHVKSAGELFALKQARLGQLADSIYFLGFLWTLFALIDSFAFHSELTTAEKSFRAFGYALVTTATGMFLRLMLIQFSYSEDEQVREAQQNVEEEISRFTKEVSNGATSIKKFQSQVNSLSDTTQSFKMTVGKVEGEITELSSKLIKMNQNNINLIDEHIKRRLDEIIEFVDLQQIKNELHNELSQVIKVIGDDAQKASRSITVANEKMINSTNKYFDTININLENIAKQINSIKIDPDVIENILDEQIGRITDAFTGVGQSIKNSNDQFSDLLTTIQESSDTVETSVLKKIEAPIKSFAKTLELLSSKINNLQISNDILDIAVKKKIDESMPGLTTSMEKLQSVIFTMTQEIDRINKISKVKTHKPWWMIWR